jgi:REP element-mobilizing transposase RayT
MVANEYIQNVKAGKFPPFEKSIWQRNYYEHIIRNDNDLDRVRDYIVNNPLNWEIDELHSRGSG